ncbi:hypothetical protein O181_062512 [Austropuccinia psidii MF-1]|uniref:Uncharacterized protein n=1 Tax=Austropuccinia psidii MF-1 TaxID=1389203 RepID=A0A9Q3ESB0_9BASI|nr:hypothetical protein [Austropuccinia psidii MF-1]
MSELPEKINFIILHSSESTSLFVTQHNKYMAGIPSFPIFEWDFLVIDTPKGEDLILNFYLINHFKPSIDWREGLMTFNPYCNNSSNSFSTLSNNLSSANTCAALVVDSRTPSFPSSFHIPFLNSPKSLLSSRDEVFKDIQDFGGDNLVSLLHLFLGNVDLSPSSYHDFLEELWDEEEHTGEIQNVIRGVPSAYHHYLDVVRCGCETLIESHVLFLFSKLV